MNDTDDAQCYQDARSIFNKLSELSRSMVTIWPESRRERMRLNVLKYILSMLETLLQQMIDEYGEEEGSSEQGEGEDPSQL